MTRAEQIVHDLRQRTLALVDPDAARKAGRAPISRVHLAKGAGFSLSWLYGFVAGHEDALNPTADTLKELEKRLSELEPKQ